MFIMQTMCSDQVKNVKISRPKMLQISESLKALQLKVMLRMEVRAKVLAVRSFVAMRISKECVLLERALYVDRTITAMMFSKIAKRKTMEVSDWTLNPLQSDD